MSFNVRYAEPTDGPDIWELRRPIVAEMLRQFSADVVGLQEPEIEQLHHMEADLPEYKRIGLSRMGNDIEKFAALLYKPATLELLETGIYWFSETPDVVASSDWLIHKPYAANWARFKYINSGFEFTVHNAQFPYKPEQARARFESARIMLQKSEGQENTIFTGDFNCNSDGDVYQLLTTQLQDSWATSPVREGIDPTFHGFTGTPTHSARLDWVLYRGAFEPTYYETVLFNVNGRYPSDHYPVFADFEVK